MSTAAHSLPTIWVGVGHAGCRTLAALRGQWPELPNLAVVHSRSEVLAQTGIERAILLPTGPAGGSGGDPTVGEHAAREVCDELRELLQDYAVVLVLSGLGGGTGSGAAPIIARIARESGAFALALATLPFMFEGPRRNQIARQSLIALQRSSDVVITVPNQRLIEWVPDGTPVQTVFQFVDHVVGGAMRTLWRLLTLPAILPLDLSDLRRLAADHSARVALASVETSGQRRVDSAIEELSISPLLDHGAVLAAAPAVLAAITGGGDLTLRELHTLASGLRAHIRPDANLTIGAMVDETLTENQIAITLLVAEPSDVRDPLAVESAPPPPPGSAEVQSTSARARQAELNLTTEAPDRFAGVAPTVREGVNVDVPTFLRRNIRLSFSARS